MKKLLSLLLLTALVQVIPAHAEARRDKIIVVAHTEETSLTLSQDQVRNLFMGASVGRTLHPAVLPPNNRTRSLFNTKVVGMSESRVQSYWAQMKFTGRRSSPLQVSNEQEMLRYLSNTPDSVGYLTGDTEIPENLTIIYSTD